MWRASTAFSLILCFNYVHLFECCMDYTIKVNGYNWVHWLATSLAHFWCCEWACHLWKKWKQHSSLIISCSQWKSLIYWHPTLFWVHTLFFFFQLWQLLLKLLNIIKCFLFYFRFIWSWAAVFNMSFMTSWVIFWQNIFTMWNISVCCQAVIFIVIAELLPVMFNYCAPAYRWQVINSIKVT